MLKATVVEIKDTLRNLTDLLTSNAVLEAQAVQLRKNIGNIEERLHTVELAFAHGAGSSRWVERLLWGLVTLALAGKLITTQAP